MDTVNEKQKTQQNEVVNQQQMPRDDKPNKILPSGRIAFKGQIDLLKAYAVISGSERKPVSNKEVSDLTQVTNVTVSTANAFFADTNLLIKSAGKHIPSDEVFNYKQALDWDKETAGHSLAPILRKTWFADVLSKRLSFESLPEQKVIQILAEEASASKKYKSLFVMLLDYLQFAGIIKREKDMVHIMKENSLQQKRPPPEPIPEKTPNKQPHIVQAPSLSESGVSFSVDIRVGMDELAGWSADRISAFFDGLAKVISAKGGLKPDRKADQG